MYLHPWEFDPDQPRMEGSVMSRLRHYLNLDKTESRLNMLLQDFSFAPIRQVFPPIEQMYLGKLVSRTIERHLPSTCQ